MKYSIEELRVIQTEFINDYHLSDDWQLLDDAIEEFLLWLEDKESQ